MDNNLFWQLYSLVYDTILQLKSYQKMMKAVIQEIIDQPDLKILDAGCGTGNFAYFLNQTQKKFDITCIDSSPQMLSQAVRKSLTIKNI